MGMFRSLEVDGTTQDNYTWAIAAELQSHVRYWMTCGDDPIWIYQMDECPLSGSQLVYFLNELIHIILIDFVFH